MTPLKLNEQEIAELQSVMRKQTGHAAFARRARCVLLCATGVRRVDIRMTLGCDDGFISRWTRAYAADGLAELEARILDRTLKSKPRDGSTHWSSRKLAAELGDVSFSAVQRIWRKHGVRPHRLDTHMVSNDPDFEAKAARGHRSVPAATRARVTPARDARASWKTSWPIMTRISKSM